MSGLPRGWKRISIDQIEHSSQRVRVMKVTFTASGVGHIYIVNYKDVKDTWCRHASTPQDLAEAFALAESYIKPKPEKK